MNRKIGDLHLATRWLADFHQQAQVSRVPWGSNDIASWVESPLTAYSQAFGATPNEQRLFGEVRNRATELTGTPFPIVWQHHDFGEWNIYREGDAIRVIDWERAKVGPALSDLLWFVVHWSIIAGNIRDYHKQLDCFGELFLDPAPRKASAKAVRQAIREYLSHLEIDCRFFPIILVLTWVEHAVDQIRRQQAIGADKEDPRQANRYIPYISILSDRTGQLFAGPIAGLT